MDFFIEACFRMAIECFDGKTSDLLKMLAQQDAKPTKERHSIPVTVRLAPEVYEGLQRLHSQTGAGSASAPAPTETPLIFAWHCYYFTWTGADTTLLSAAGRGGGPGCGGDATYHTRTR